ncbi:DEAD/DEAH box helicase [Algiphilus sp. W345]|uniref:DEAD/DEAH box helicase n=1 Tax=Banduia mediterranea TaxID=3075609 RepID=A0ABU2WMJ7_9GAMM|nr:DEAD/DEAH box helicase [Algiphilus sp. W345]MDT0499103.1 DEAD/DEAH box helicase [Algiphilus sp. W345]
MPEIQLSPATQLHWIESTGAEFPDRDIAGIFDANWREGLFLLAARRPQTHAWPSLRYWQGISESYLTGLCHLPPDAADTGVPPPTPARLDGWIVGAPPLSGGEYLSADVLLEIWQTLDGWVQQTLKADRGLGRFIEKRAPKWRQVGRVCLHLAENKADPERPFAFMATYTSGLGDAGRLRHLPLGKALEQYAGARNRAALLHLLTPLQQASEREPWLRELMSSGDIYRPHAWAPPAAHRLLKSVPQLENCGLTVRIPDWWKARPRPQVKLSVEQRQGAGLGLDAVLDFDLNLALGDEKLSAADTEALLSGGDGLVLFKGRWIEVDHERLRQALDHWRSVERQTRSGEIGFIEGMRLLAGAPTDLGDDSVAQVRDWSFVEAGPTLRGTLAELRDPSQLHNLDVIRGLKAQLRPYQRHGVNWLHFLSRLGLGACLADDMGLGKTVQVLALLLSLRGAAASPSLLVVPASLLGNWRGEAQRFAPSLKLQFLHPAETARDELVRIAETPAVLGACELVVTTYSMLHRQPWLRDVDWRLVILDEAQAIKNPGTRQSKAVKALKAQARIALTGTPVENRLGDLWSLFDFINPGLLGNATAFKTFAKRLGAGPEPSYAPLRQLVSPYVLRRMKTDRSIIADLPPKTETPQFCTLSRPQARLYQQVVENLTRALDSAEGIARSGLVLQTLMRLKQVCNHPSQLNGDGAFETAASGKFQRLTELCEELAERQDRVLVFTQFREVINPLSQHLAGIFGRPGLSLHGETAVRARQDIVDRFQAADGPPFLVLSLKAGGTGLNLTAANHVIHFDRWWNPAVENQATDRAFRIGQKRHVLVHKFVTRGTIEERIDALIADKQKLSDELLAGAGEVKLSELPDEQLLELVRLDLKHALM